MLRLHWNELKVGDHVLVHDVDQPHLRLVPGVVSCVDTATGSNDRDTIRRNWRRSHRAAAATAVPSRPSRSRPAMLAFRPTTEIQQTVKSSWRDWISVENAPQSPTVTRVRRRRASYRK